MRHRIRRHPLVAEDIFEIAVYIAKDNQDAALRFLDAVELTITRLRDHPRSGWLRDFDDPRLARLRSASIKGFSKYMLFYEVEHDGIYIAAVIHGARLLPPILRGRR